MRMKNDDDGVDQYNNDYDDADSGRGYYGHDDYNDDEDDGGNDRSEGREVFLKAENVEAFQDV